MSADGVFLRGVAHQLFWLQLREVIRTGTPLKRELPHGYKTPDISSAECSPRP